MCSFNQIMKEKDYLCWLAAAFSRKSATLFLSLRSVTNNSAFFRTFTPWSFSQGGGGSMYSKSVLKACGHNQANLLPQLGTKVYCFLICFKNWRITWVEVESALLYKTWSCMYKMAPTRACMPIMLPGHLCKYFKCNLRCKLRYLWIKLPILRRKSHS